MSSHPIVRRIKSLKADFIGTIDTIGSKSDVNKYVLVQTSNLTKTVPVPAIVSLAVGKKIPNPQEYGFKNLPVAVLVEGNFKSAFSGIIPLEIKQSKDIDFKEISEPTRQIFIADGDMIRNVLDSRNQPMPAGYDRYNNILYDNTEFIINCVNYLCDDDDLLNLRAKNFKIGKLDPNFIKQESRFWIIFNLTVPSALILLLGVVLVVIRTRKYGKKIII
jgi:gliding-associated putative ABC transporter substrate-binding component GldG